MVAVPVDTPVTMPEYKPTVAKVLLLDHVPPADASAKVVVDEIAPAAHTFGLPVIFEGNALTNTVL